MKKDKGFPLSFFKSPGNLLDYLYNRLLLARKNVSYKTMPLIFGKMAIVNKGTIVLGENIRFNCAVKSNYVGLYKTCSIAVLKNARVEIGNSSGFSGVSIYCANSITIGNYVNCGGNVSIWDTDFHPLNFNDRRIHDTSKIKQAAIHIGDDVFIGANAIVLKGVTIGARSIIGAGSVVTKTIPSDEVWAGNPAKFIRKCS